MTFTLFRQAGFVTGGAVVFLTINHKKSPRSIAHSGGRQADAYTVLFLYFKTGYHLRKSTFAQTHPDTTRQQGKHPPDAPGAPEQRRHDQQDDMQRIADEGKKLCDGMALHARCFFTA